MADIPDNLINLERAAEAERTQLASLVGEAYDVQWRRWRAAADTFHGAVTEHAKAIGQNRYELEQDVKKAVRHGEPGPAA